MCRMLLAVGKINMAELIDGAISMAKDENRIHEYNSEKGLGSWTHGDGWGIAYLKSGTWVIKKSSKAIYDDDLTEKIKLIKTTAVVIHARYKTVGETMPENTHPFHINTKKHGNFVFCHNGTVEDEISFSDVFEVKGSTDSEKLFYSILTDFEKSNDPLIIRRNIKKYKKCFGSNIILSTPKKSIVSVNAHASYPIYYRMFIGQNQQWTVIGSEELPQISNMSWEKIGLWDTLTVDHVKCKVSFLKSNT
jgi:predicted glutamine amidotransferase